MQKRLLDELLKKYPELTEIKSGQGNKRYIFKKEDEDQVKSKIKSIKHKSSKKFNISEIQEIENYLQENYANKQLSTIQFRDIFSTEFNIKSNNKTEGILKQLSKRNRIKTISIGNFRVLPSGVD